MSYFLFFLIFFSFSINSINGYNGGYGYERYQYRILHTSIFHFTNIIKQHHIVIIEPRHTKPGLYAVDFTPVKQNSFKTLIYLMIGMNVPAEIRVRYIIDKIDVNEKDEIIQEKWSSRSLNVEPINVFYPVDELIQRYKKWEKPYMNLYTRNCQHFSYDLIQILNDPTI